MKSGSKVFADMFETGTSQGSNEVALTESSEVLELFLPFCQFKPAELVEIGSDEFWLIAKALDKYDVSVCVKSPQSGRCARLMTGSGWHPIQVAGGMAAFALLAE